MNDIRQIADTTVADLFLSFDVFAAQDGIFSPRYKLIQSDSASIRNISFYDNYYATEVVYILSNWNFYDLKKQKLIFSHLKADTIKWAELAHNLAKAKRVLHEFLRCRMIKENGSLK